VLRDLGREIDEEIAALEGKYDKDEVSKRFSTVRHRLLFVRCMPILLMFLLSLGLLVSLDPIYWSQAQKDVQELSLG